MAATAHPFRLAPDGTRFKPISVTKEIQLELERR